MTDNLWILIAAAGIMVAVIGGLSLLAEFLPPDSRHPTERRYIVSVFKLVQELLAPSGVRGKNWFSLLMDRLPETHKARWFAGAAPNSSKQAMASVMSTVLSWLNAFLDSELEQVLCFDSAINAEQFAAEKPAIFGGFAPNSQTAEQLSKSLGSRTVLSGSVSKGKNDPSQSLQMMERPLMTPDELKSIPKGSFVVMKTGIHPMQTKLRLFLDWGSNWFRMYSSIFFA